MPGGLPLYSAGSQPGGPGGPLRGGALLRSGLRQPVGRARRLLREAFHRQAEEPEHFVIMFFFINNSGSNI